jgi:L-ascorbate metabolism protein UlaG (beta-lactamase superfamily)
MKELALCAVLVAGCARASSSAPAGAGASTGSHATDHFATSKGSLDVTPLNHASLLLGWGSKSFYVDPTMVALADPTLPKADVIFITDIHPDHFDPAAIARVSKEGTLIVGPPAVAEKAHVDVVMKNGDAQDVSGVGAEAVPMYNLVRGPAPGALYHDKGRGNGYVLDFGGLRVYLSGDTECTPEMRALSRIDVAFVCMNLPYTMPPAEALQCVKAFHPKVLLPYHYRGSDLSELRVLAAQGVEVRMRNWY